MYACANRLGFDAVPCVGISVIQRSMRYFIPMACERCREATEGPRSKDGENKEQVVVDRMIVGDHRDDLFDGTSFCGHFKARGPLAETPTVVTGPPEASWGGGRLGAFMVPIH
jgi:hypothetical protein